MLYREVKERLEKDLKRYSINELALMMGIIYPTLYRIVKGQSKGDITTWERIANFYGFYGEKKD